MTTAYCAQQWSKIVYNILTYKRKSRQCVVRKLCDSITSIILIWIILLQLLHVIVVHILGSVLFYFKELILLYNNDALNWTKVIVKIFTLPQFLFQTSAILWTLYSLKNNEKCITVLDSWAPYQHIRMISAKSHATLKMLNGCWKEFQEQYFYYLVI